MEVNEQFPAANSVWMYKSDPARLYVVRCMANVTARNAAHPPHVVYVTKHSPDRVWVRTVDDFLRVMSPAQVLA